MQRWKITLILILVFALAPLSLPVRAQDGATITTISVPDVLPGGGTRLRLSPDGRYLAVWTEPAIVGDVPSPLYMPIHLYDLSDPAAPKEMLLVAGHTDHTMGVAFSPDSAQLVTYQRNSQFFVWETASGAFQKQFFPGVLGSAVFDFLPDGGSIAWLLPGPMQQTALLNPEDGSYERILARRLATFAELTTQGERSIPASLVALAVAPDGKHVATATMYGDILVWDVETGEMLPLLISPDTVPGLEVRTLAYSDDGATLYFSNNRDEMLFALDVASGADSEIGAAPLGLFAVLPGTGKLVMVGADGASLSIVDPADPMGGQEVALPITGDITA
ncbi:MAG: WD40 repeat domain-containing protein, partial [Chloroflexi bacterium]